MAVVAETGLSGGGYVRLHNDFVPTDEKERTARIHAFQAVVANLISTGQIRIDGVEAGDRVECKIVTGGEEGAKLKGDKGRAVETSEIRAEL